MSILKFANNAQTTLAAPLAMGATSVTLTPGAGALFPTLTTGFTFLATLTDAATGLINEIVLATANAADVVTIVRAQEGTTDVAWLTGDFFSMLDTAGTMQVMVQSAQLQSGTYSYAHATGTGDALAATVGSSLTVIPDGMPLIIKSIDTNTGAATLTLTLGSTVLASKSILKGNALPLEAGDIPDSDFDIFLIWNVDSDAYMMQNPNIVVVAPANILAYRNLQASAPGTSANVSISADEVTLETTGNNYVTARAVALTLNTAGSGVNGLDTGSLAANTWYAVWLIHNGSVVNSLLSLSSTAPTMPGGYTYKSRIGWIRTDGSGSKFPLSFKQAGADVQYVVDSGGNVTALPSLISGASGSISTPTWTAAAWATSAPPTAVELALIASTTTGTVMTAPNSSYGNSTSTTNPAPMRSLYVSEARIIIESANMYYACDSINGRLQCLGWRDNF